jgi:hypothetical protein
MESRPKHHGCETFVRRSGPETIALIAGGTMSAVRLFISWSGDASRAMAELVNDWIPQVIQEVEPWFSKNIDKGQRWAMEIGTALSGTHQGIICVTPDNREAPWLNFEAGAVAKALDESRVRPVLLGLQPSELTGPLAQFQTTIACDRSDMFKLVESINACCLKPLENRRLERAFDRNWHEVDVRIKEIDLARVPVPVHRTQGEMLGELVERVRGIEYFLRVEEPRRQPSSRPSRTGKRSRQAQAQVDAFLTEVGLPRSYSGVPLGVIFRKAALQVAREEGTAGKHLADGG